MIQDTPRGSKGIDLNKVKLSSVTCLYQ